MSDDPRQRIPGSALPRYRVLMLLAEDLLLLLTDDQSGKASLDVTRVDLGLAGAVLVELVTRERVAIAQPGGPVKAGRVVVVDGSPTGDGILDEGLRRIATGKPRKPEHLLAILRKDLRRAVYGQLVSRGIVREEEGKILGLFPTRSWPAVDSQHEAMVRTALREVLVDGRAPTLTEASLVSLLQGIDRVPKTLGEVGVPARELRRRAKSIATGHLGNTAVHKAVEAVNAAMVASIAAAAAAGAS